MRQKHARKSNDIAAQGERLYAKKFAPVYEPDDDGKYLAIDVDKERAYVADSPEEALKAAQRNNPGGAFHLVKIGSEGLYRVATQSYGSRIVR